MDTTESKAQLVHDLRDEQAQFEALLGEIGEAHMIQHGVAGHWSIKDIVAHLTGWRRRTVARFQAALLQVSRSARRSSSVIFTRSMSRICGPGWAR